jgi:hypothetical protein
MRAGMRWPCGISALVVLLCVPSAAQAVPFTFTVLPANGDIVGEAGTTIGREAGIDCARATIHKQPGGWAFLVISGYDIAGGFQPGGVDLLVTLRSDRPQKTRWVYA